MSKYINLEKEMVFVIQNQNGAQLNMGQHKFTNFTTPRTLGEITIILHIIILQLWEKNVIMKL
jgi:hypothetical protein